MHAAQTLAPAAEAVPFGHAAHDAAPAVMAKVPAAQLEHTPASAVAEKVPGLQSVHTVLLLDVQLADTRDPGAQAAHGRQAPLLRYELAGQLVQLAAEAPHVAQLASQGVHARSALARQAML